LTHVISSPPERSSLAARPSPAERSAALAVYTSLASIAVASFIGALLTDIAYWRSFDMMWTNFSAWLLMAGLIVGFAAAIAGLIALARHRFLRQGTAVWAHAVGNLIVLALSVFNALIHTRDAWASVVPTGLTLSAVVAIILLVTTWLGLFGVRRQRVGVAL
jgi:uncharacterized membrane protein